MPRWPVDPVAESGPLHNPRLRVANRIDQPDPAGSVGRMSDSMVTIATYPNPIEGEIACEYLCSEGFSAQIANQAMQTVVLGAGNPLVRIELQVPAREATEAAQRLREQQAAVRQAEREEGPVAMAVPRPDGIYQSDWNERERLVERAYRCAIIGPPVPVPLVSWYGLLCALDALGRDEPLRESQRRRFTIALVVSAVFSLLWLGFLVVAVAALFGKR